MAANNETNLLSKVIDEGAFKRLIDEAIDKTYFSTTEGVMVYQFLRNWYHDEHHYGETPSLSIVQKYNPQTHLKVPRDSIDALLVELRKGRLSREWDLLLDDLGELVDEHDFEKALLRMNDQYTAWRSGNLQDHDIIMNRALGQIQDQYERAKAAEGMLGIPGPWEPFNQGTMGLQPGDWMVLYGRPGNMKTWLGLKFATHAYEMGRRVLFFSAEMMEKKIAHRAAALLAGVDWDQFRHGDLPDDLEAVVWEILRQLRRRELEDAEDNAATFAITTGRGIMNGKSVDGIRQKIEEHGPIDMVVVDGIYLMAGTGSSKHEQVASISNGCQALSNDLGIPFIGITQANREARKGKGDDVGEIGYSDALGQDAGIAGRAIRHWDQEAGRYFVTIAWGKGRDGAIPAFSINTDVAYDMNYVATRSPSYVREAVAAETVAMEREAAGEDGPPVDAGRPKPTRGRFLGRRKRP